MDVRGINSFKVGELFGKRPHCMTYGV